MSVKKVVLERRRTPRQPRVTALVKEAQHLNFRAILLLAHQTDDLYLTRPLPAGKSVDLCPYCRAELEPGQNQCSECDNFVASL